MRSATCHPERPERSRGLCSPCYQKAQRAGIDRTIGRAIGQPRDAQEPETPLDPQAQAQAALKVERARTAALESDLQEARLRIAAYEPEGRLPGDVAIPKWSIPPKGKRGTRGHHATPTLLLTDTHFGEVVNPAEIFRANAYSTEIAERRLRYTVERTGIVVREYMGGLDVDGIVVALGGDIITGTIHDELADTNDERPPETIVRFVPQIAAGLKALADEFGHVYVPAVSGNHDRTQKRPRHKSRAQDSWSWIIYHWLRQLVADDERITVDVAEGSDLLYQIYNTRFLLTHGDQFKGGSGIAGVMSPLALGNHRKGKRNQALGVPHDIMVMGHFHQTLYLPGVFVGGAMKGYDEYAFDLNFLPEPPRQSLWLTTPERGVTIKSHIDCEPAGWAP